MEEIVSTSQLVIYGANGWLGRSALSAANNGSLRDGFKEVLLIGSKESFLEINGQTYPIHDPHAALEKIQHGAVFFNSAFLRREYLQKMDEAEYISKNKQISEFAYNVLDKFELGSFINISSGVASKTNIDAGITDLYAKLKGFWENEFEEGCRNRGSAFLNCRIFSMTGRFLNEFDNLAISAFIKSAMEDSVLEVRSPKTQRTYLDSEQLSEVLLRLGKKGISSNLDSGGVLVSMGDLAQTVVDVVGLGTVEEAESDQTSDYFGDYQRFNSIAITLDIEIDSLKKQIENTLLAFSKFRGN